MSVVDTEDFSWLLDYLRSTSSEIDVEVVGDFLIGVLSMSTTYDGLEHEIQEILSAHLPFEVAQSSSKEIIDQFKSRRLNNTQVQHSDCSINEGWNEVVTVEEKLRSLMKADSERIVIESKPTPTRRDVCTIAALRSAGVSGYQGDAQAERELEIAMANAEFKCSQKLNVQNGLSNASLNGNSDAGSESETDSYLDDIEGLSGYGKKDDVKPGTVEDALSTLNPHSVSSVLPALTSTKKVVRANDSLNVRPPQLLHKVDHSFDGDKPKKKGPPPSKHIARIGARAEAKQRQNLNSGSNSSTARPRYDEIEAFLFDDLGITEADSTQDFPEGGRNHERVHEEEIRNRESASLAAAARRNQNKLNNERQLAAAGQRKDAARARCQKGERRK